MSVSIRDAAAHAPREDGGSAGNIWATSSNLLWQCHVRMSLKTCLCRSMLFVVVRDRVTLFVLKDAYFVLK